MSEDGGIGHHGYGLAVILAPLHKYSLSDRSVHVAKHSIVLRHGILADIDLGTGLCLIVISVILTYKEFRGIIVVLIFQFHRLCDSIEPIAVSNEMNVGPPFFDSMVELHISAHIIVAAKHKFLLVTYFHVF